MQNSADATLATPSDHAEAALRQAIAEMQPGWVLLQGCSLGSEGKAALRLRYVLLHQDVGMALLTTEPDSKAVARLQQRLDAVGFRSRFGGYPPVICRMLPPPDLPLAEVLTAAFALEPPLVLPAGGEWVEALRQALRPAEPPDAEADPTAEPAFQENEEQPAAEPRPPMPADDELAEATTRSDLPSAATKPVPAEDERTAMAVHRPHRRYALLLSCGLLALALGGTAAIYRGRPGWLGLDSARDPTLARSGSLLGASEDSPDRSGTGQAREAAMPPLSEAEPPAPSQPASPAPAVASSPLDLPPTPTAPGESQVDLTTPAPPSEQPEQSTVRHGPVVTEETIVAPLDKPPFPAANQATQEPDLASLGAVGGSAPEPVAADMPPAGSAAAAPPRSDPAIGAALPPGAVAVESERPEVSRDMPPAPRSVASEGAPAAAKTASVPPPQLLASEPAVPPRPPAQDRGPEAPGSPAMAGQVALGDGGRHPSQPTVPAAGGSVQMAPAMLAALIQRGDAMFALRDVSAARLLYERAAEGGSAAAATAAGRTYDPAFLVGDGARASQADPAAAAAWYRKAIALGDRQAEEFLRRLGSRAGN